MFRVWESKVAYALILLAAKIGLYESDSFKKVSNKT